MTFCLLPEAVVIINQKVVGHAHAVRDLGALEGALARPLQDVFGQQLYPTLDQRAAALLQGVAAAHAFLDGNKRTAWICCNTYLEQHSRSLNHMSDEESGGLIIELVEREKNIADAALWISDHSRYVPRQV